MKKYIALFLTIALALFVLAGCSSESAVTTAGGAATDSAVTTAASTAPVTEEVAEPESGAIRWTGDKIGNGEAVVAIVPTLQAESVVAWSNVWADEMRAAGYSPTVVSAETTVANYVTLIEDYTQQGVVGIFTAPMDADAIQDAVLGAIDKGVCVVFLGAASENYDPSGGVNTDYYWTGYGAVRLAVDWLENEAALDTSNPIPVAINTYYEIVNGANRSQGYKDAIEESNLLSLGYEEAFYTSEADGYVFAQNALTKNPDIRIFIGYEADTARGVNSYLVNEYLPANPDLDILDFLVVSAYYDEAAVTEVDKAEVDPTSTAFRAYITYGSGNTETGLAVSYVHLSLLSGQKEAPFWYYDNVSSRTSWGGIGTYTRLS